MLQMLLINLVSGVLSQFSYAIRKCNNDLNAQLESYTEGVC